MTIHNWFVRMISHEYRFLQPLPIVISQIIEAIRVDEGVFRGMVDEICKRFDRAISGLAPSDAVGTRQEDHCAFDTLAVVLASLISDGANPRFLLAKTYYGGRVRAMCRGGRAVVRRRIRRRVWPSRRHFEELMHSRSTEARAGDHRMLELLARGGRAALFAVSTRATVFDAFSVQDLEVGRCEALLRDVIVPFEAVFRGEVCAVGQRENRAPLCRARQRVQGGTPWCELASDWVPDEEVNDQVIEQLRELARLVKPIAAGPMTACPSPGTRENPPPLLPPQ